MPNVCELCRRGTQVGNTVTRRGLAKHRGGVGLKTTGITRRTFKVNLQKIRVLEKGVARRMKICTHCLKAGKITKRVN
ncbi:MAG: 50S ribosomal protein L28 [Planctomycetota bacterium]